MNEYEAHLMSYDHSHKQRLKEMKAMVRDPTAAARARKQEARADGVISIKLGDNNAANAGGGGFKKGGFKKIGFKPAFPPADEAEAAAPVPAFGTDKEEAGSEAKVKAAVPGGESDTEDEGYDVYDPHYPTD